MVVLIRVIADISDSYTFLPSLYILTDVLMMVVSPCFIWPLEMAISQCWNTSMNSYPNSVVYIMLRIARAESLPTALFQVYISPTLILVHGYHTPVLTWIMAVMIMQVTLKDFGRG